jgi:hypothetical protein
MSKVEKTFTIAGVSLCKGSYKVRHANDLSRIKTLEKTGHTEIVLVQLPSAMTTSLLDSVKVAEPAVVEPKAVKAPKVKKEKKVKVVLQPAEAESYTLDEALAAEFAEDENAPF